MEPQSTTLKDMRLLVGLKLVMKPGRHDSLDG